MQFEQKYLDEYAYLGNKAYLNCCSVAMQPQRTLDFCRGFQQQFVDTMGNICFGPYGEMRDGVRDTLAGMIGASRNEILLTPNTSAGDSLLINANLLQPGDSVVLSNFDYPAVAWGWYQLQARGIRVNTVKAVNGCVRAEDLIAAMDSSTKVCAVSQVQYMSGYQTDLLKLGEACHVRGVILNVDGIQGLGRNPVDVKKCHIGVYSCGGFKGLLGVLGAAFCYVDSDLLPRLQPQSWGEDNIPMDEHLVPAMDEIPVMPLGSGAERLESGSLNTYGILAMGLGAGLLTEIGTDRIHTHVIELEQYYRQLLKDLPVHFMGSEDEQYWSGTPCLTMELFREEKLLQALKEREIYATVREVRGEALLRIGIHYYNTREHIERLADALKNVFDI